MLLKTCRLRKSAFYCFCYSLRLHTPFDIRKVLEVFFLFLFVLRQQNDFFRCLLLNLIFQAYLLSQQKRIWHRGNFIEHIGLTGATNISWYKIHSEVAQGKLIRFIYYSKGFWSFKLVSSNNIGSVRIRIDSTKAFDTTGQNDDCKASR